MINQKIIALIKNTAAIGILSLSLLVLTIKHASAEQRIMAKDFIQMIERGTMVLDPVPHFQMSESHQSAFLKILKPKYPKSNLTEGLLYAYEKRTSEYAYLVIFKWWNSEGCVFKSTKIKNIQNGGDLGDEVAGYSIPVRVCEKLYGMVLR